MLNEGSEESNTVTLLCQCPQSVNYSDGFCFCEYRSLCAGSNVAKELSVKYPALSANIQHQSNKPLADDSVSAGPPGN